MELLVGDVDRGACSSSVFASGLSDVNSFPVIAGVSAWFVVSSRVPVFCVFSDESRNTNSIGLIGGCTGKSSVELSPRIITSSCPGDFHIFFDDLVYFWGQLHDSFGGSVRARGRVLEVSSTGCRLWLFVRVLHEVVWV